MSFSLDDAARAEIERRKRDSNCSEPVATLGELADAEPGMQRRISEALKRDAPEDELLSIAQSELPHQVDFRLEVFIYEKEDCSPGDLVLVSDIAMAIPQAILQALSPYRLTFDGDRFFLSSSNRILTNLRSLADEE